MSIIDLAQAKAQIASEEANLNNEEQQEVVETEESSVDDDISEAQDTEDESEEQESEKAPKWVSELRKQNREFKREIRELRKSTSTNEPEQQALVKPKLSEFDYDSDAYETALDNWYQKKQQADLDAQKMQSKQQKAQEEYHTKLKSYNENRTKYDSFDEKEEVVKNIFSEQQQGVILKYTKDPARIVNLLGKFEEEAEALANSEDLGELIAGLVRFEAKHSLQKRTAPAPEKKVQGASKPLNANEAKIESMRAKLAESGGDMSQLLALKRQLRGK